MWTFELPNRPRGFRRNNDPVFNNNMIYCPYIPLLNHIVPNITI